MTANNLVVKKNEMPEDMLQTLVGFAQEGMEARMSNDDIAGHVRQQMASTYTGTWQCLAGRNFAASVTHEEKKSAYFYLGQMGFMCWRTV